MTIEHDALFIGGEWRKPASDGRISIVSPNTEEVLATVPEGTAEDIDRAVESARTALESPAGWTSLAPADRADALERLAVEFETRVDDLVSAVSSQNGVPVSVAMGGEGSFPPMLLRYYAGLIRSGIGPDIRPGALGGTVAVERTPVGVVGAIVPWNSPQALAAFKYAPALAAGCPIILKPSPETLLDSYVLAEAVRATGLPEGTISIIGGGPATGAHLVAHAGVDKVAFTGSTAAGRNVAEVCGRLLKPVTLELGGKSSAILLDDVDLASDSIAENFYGSTLLNNGQVCFLGTRVLAPRARYNEVVEFVTEMALALKVGDSLSPDTQMGPLVSSRQRDRVEGYIAKGKESDARITTGGGRPAGLDRGWFVEPTVFADVDNSDVIAREEIFGPVLSVIPYTDDAEAVEIANDSDYGLGGTVWSADYERAVGVAQRVRTGSIGVNRYIPDPVAPIGGIKASGLGRELGPEGLEHYYSIKSIYR